jgi:macrodomain Ter protein organizer (MatP/YcbG family)
MLISDYVIHLKNMAPPKKTTQSKKTSTLLNIEIYREVEIIANESKWTISHTISILVEEAVNTRKHKQRCNE